MKDDPEFNIAFVSMVQQFPCLYDNTSSDYSNKTLQLKAWETIAGQVNESVLDCKDRWKNLRGCFTRHLKHKGDLTSNRYRKPYYLAQHLNFLLPFTKSRLLVSNDVCDSFQNEDDDTVVDDDGDDQYNENGDDVNGVGDDRLVEEYDLDGNPSDERQDTGGSGGEDGGGGGRSILAKRLIKTEQSSPYGESCTKWQNSNSGAKKMRLDSGARQASEDADMLFLRSILPDLRSMDGSQRRRLKIGILQLCEDILNEASFRA